MKNLFSLYSLVKSTPMRNSNHTKIFHSLLCLCLVSITTICESQTITGEIVKSQFTNDWERAKAYTLEYLNAMPAEKYSFRATDSTRSFAQQMLHLAQGSIYLIVNATGQKPILLDRRLETIPTAQSKDSVVYFVTASYDFVIEGIKNLDASKLGEKIKRAADEREETRFAWIEKAFEHQTHHRGQTTIYIRLAGLRPPQERLY